MKVYLFGYSGQNFDRFQAAVEALDAMVLDIRFSPHSRTPIWSKVSLSLHLGNIAEDSSSFCRPHYLPVPEWGNVNYNSGFEIKIADFDTGLRAFQTLERLHYPAVVLLL